MHVGISVNDTIFEKICKVNKKQRQSHLHSKLSAEFFCNSTTLQRKVAKTVDFSKDRFRCRVCSHQTTGATKRPFRT